MGCLLAACGGSSKTPPAGSAGTAGGPSQPIETVCSAGERRCVALNVKVCSDDGTAETIEQTCLPTQTCSDGACAENACLANTHFCKDGAIPDVSMRPVRDDGNRG